jgi:hypothetical protein
MSGLTILTENNQNYNISTNNINSFTSSSFSPYDFIINKSITYSSGISSAGQTFGCYDNSLYYIYGDSITQFNFQSDKINVFISLTSQPRQLEIYNNFMIIGYGSGNTGVYSSLFNIYNFSSNSLYTGNFSYDYYYLQFAIINGVNIFSIDANGEIYNCKVNFNPLSLTKISSISIDAYGNQMTISANNNNLMFAINGGGGHYPLNQFGYYTVNSASLNSSISCSADDFGNIYNISDLGNYGILGSQSYYITNKNTGGTTAYSYGVYSTYLSFADSSYDENFIPINITNYAFTKLPVLVNNSNYQEFCYNGKIVSVYLPIGSGNTIFNTNSYIVKGNSNLIIIVNNEVYVYPLHTYNLNVKSYNTLNNQIQDYFSLNGIIYTGYSNSFSFSQLPQTLIPLNTSTYYYNGSAITIIQSDFSGSGSNLYYNLSIYYQEIKPATIPLYDIFTYIYPISIIGLFVGMGAFIFTIKKRGYKI